MRSALFLLATTFVMAATVQAGPKLKSNDSKCLAATHALVGKRAEVLKCGFFNDAKVLETIAVVRKTKTKGKCIFGQGIYVTKLAILRQEPSGWSTALKAGRYIMNSIGYVGADYLDDVSPFWANCLGFFDRDKETGPGIILEYMANEKDSDELGVDIAWDPSVSRYREYNTYEEPMGFKPEHKNLPALTTLQKKKKQAP
jgi:hypothetical protein